MASFSAKIFHVFRNMKADAVPRAPRPTAQQSTHDVNEDDHNNDEHLNSCEEPEEIFIGQKGEKPKHKKKAFGTKKRDPSEKSKKGDKVKNGFGNHVNTQATGCVINIVDSSKVHCGNEFVYYLGPTNAQPKNDDNDHDSDNEPVEKTNLITLLLEADITPEHEYIDYISKNLGRKWHSFFRRLGYTKGRIETFEIDEAKNGVSEARYKLLLDWVRNDDIGTLGHLASHLWQEGERHIVKDLSIIYSKNKH